MNNGVDSDTLSLIGCFCTGCSLHVIHHKIAWELLLDEDKFCLYGFFFLPLQAAVKTMCPVVLCSLWVSAALSLRLIHSHLLHSASDLITVVFRGRPATVEETTTASSVLFQCNFVLKMCLSWDFMLGFHIFQCLSQVARKFFGLCTHGLACEACGLRFGS